MKKIEENLANYEKQMSLSLAIMPRNPIITARAVIIMQNCYIHLNGYIGQARGQDGGILTVLFFRFFLFCFVLFWFGLFICLFVCLGVFIDRAKALDHAGSQSRHRIGLILPSPQ